MSGAVSSTESRAYLPQKTIKAFIIHLKRAENRRAQVSRLVAELPVEAEILDAVDSHTLPQPEIDRVYRRQLHRPRYPFALSINEIACFLSHRKAWQAIVDQNLDAGLVIEDDVALNAAFDAAFAAACSHLKSGDFIRFPFRADRETGEVVFAGNDVRIIEPVPVGLGMVAQLVSREAAQGLLAATETFDRPVDTTAQMNWVTGLRPFSVIPGGVEEISARLGGSTIKQKKSLADKLKREILRPLYRGQVVKYSNETR
jgi:GR25 family glycosyltransferase involved in LPS biosynthesis